MNITSNKTKRQPIQLSDHFDYPRLLRFTLPCIIMMIFNSIYSVVDGYFVSNYVGKTPFAAVNFIMPLITILGSVGFMFGAGGGALVARSLGEGKKERARRLFSLFVYVTAISGTIIAVLVFIFLEPILQMMGAEGQLLQDALLYGRILLPILPFYMLQFEFNSFLVTAEKPKLGLIVALIAGVLNMTLDALFMVVFKWGLAGAAVATGISQMIGGLIPLIYFLRPNSSLLQLGPTHFNGPALLRACTNGSSELMSNIALSLVSMLYNRQLLNYVGENGVAAYGVIMYVSFVFLAIFIGYSNGIAPVTGYHFGAGNHAELRSLLHKSLKLTAVLSMTMLILAQLFGGLFAKIFVGYDPELLALTVHAFRIYAFVYLFAGFATYSSSFFTALSDGLTSALIAFLRSLVFEISMVLILPIYLKVDGIWLSAVLADMFTVIVAFAFIIGKRKRYHY
ncbi:MAG: MATE family efflux transporter [Peptococcaceae bacterium]|jgi:putative MATE family efflux protein|nr:MATE family efflux transporter [Peptococcaceae bacterium]